jgi:multidrug resistance efflux pump
MLDRVLRCRPLGSALGEYATEVLGREYVRSPLGDLRLFVTTLATAVVAFVLASEMWHAYMAAPQTRDGTVRAYVVPIAPAVAGRVVQLPATDNELVHNGDLPMMIDPTDYAIAVDDVGAAVTQARANADNAARKARRRAQLTNLETSDEEKQRYASNAEAAEATYRQAVANRQS